MKSESGSYQSARLLAERYIDYQPRTSAEVRRRLQRADCDPAVIERVISELEAAGLLDDAKFSVDWVESRARRKGLGPARLAAELRMKGISKEEAESALEQLDPESELQNALALARKRLGIRSPQRPGEPTVEHEDEIENEDDPIPDTPYPIPEDKRRLSAYLQRRGYNWEIIQQVFAELFQNTD